ncbi:MAG: glutaredoxin 3 [Alphaproteobacteria bacterium]|nr:glutaredoxin 3 [Alphaproteobacteria bacterium]
MSEITIYTTPFCSYCVSAKALLRRKGVAFREIDVSGNLELRREMTEKAHGHRTVPQIFAGDRYVGDSDGIHELERRGELDARLELA